MQAVRLGDGPIVTPGTPGAENIGTNLNGPSLIRVPDWLPDPLGRYYLYFAHHQGDHIRLAYADELTGPWRVHTPGTLRLAHTPFPSYIASPDVHVDDDQRRIVMDYHGCCVPLVRCKWTQPTCVAFSPDGLSFESRTEYPTAPAQREAHSSPAYSSWQDALAGPTPPLASLLAEARRGGHCAPQPACCPIEPVPLAVRRRGGPQGVPATATSDHNPHRPTAEREPRGDRNSPGCSLDGPALTYGSPSCETHPAGWVRGAVTTPQPPAAPHRPQPRQETRGWYN